MNVEFISSFSSLASRYDAFILDIWGVIHDGQKLYPGARDCLERLRAAGKKIVLLSNAPRRAMTVAERLLHMGVSENSWDALITSGEAAYQCLAKANAYFQPAGNRYVYIGLEKDRRILEGLNYTETTDPESAHFLLLSHSYTDNQPLSELEPLLTRCLKAGLPALCINPDTEIVRQNGERVYCAGMLAAYYAERGGQVIYFGKPHPIVYAKALEVFRDIDKTRILAVGDNLATDIQGARNNGIQNMLVTGGILKQEAGEPGTPAYLQRCNALFTQANASAAYVMAEFVW